MKGMKHFNITLFVAPHAAEACSEILSNAAHSNAVSQSAAFRLSHYQPSAARSSLVVHARFVRSIL